ncbi:MAG: hypothetical protein JWN90_59 [Parcubacteria group bacterium]|nr:hypothetical protein [Parcubacteria group bacterium]
MAFEGPARPVSTPEEELAYLRAQIAEKELELSALKETQPREDIAHERILHHRDIPTAEVLAPAYALTPEAAHALALNLDPESDDDTIEELRGIMETKGIKNVFAVLEKLNSPHLEDDFHRFLVQYLTRGMPIQGFSEKQPAWKSLHMTLYEIALPETQASDGNNPRPLKELISAMEQFYAGMLAVEKPYANEPPYYSLELAVPVNQTHLMFYAAIPNSRRDLFEKQILAIFPNAQVTPQPNDYNVFVQDGAAIASVASFARPQALPLKDYADFDYDPINSLLNAFAKIAPENEGASLQILIMPEHDRHATHFQRILGLLRKGEHRDTALRHPESFFGEAFKDLSGTLFGNAKKQEEYREKQRSLDANKMDIEQVEKKISSPLVSVNLRLAVSSQDPARAEQLLGELEAAFHQFENPNGNRLQWNRISKASLKRLFHDFTFRLFETGTELALSLRELTTMYHFPPSGIESSPHLKQSRAKGAAAPAELPRDGIVLGTNTFGGKTTEVRLADQDRLRHLYIIGQTGAGKSGMLRTLIEQDIKDGKGVCFIDPHGNDILEVLATVPPERYEDVIYFDPANIDRPFGLNMLEYDPARPEQKSFIVNEMLAIFRQLYGDVPESMGPAFEQYFRNATQLVMEDPASGSTLMDIGRVLSNKPFRDLKLSKSMNPIVNQFWNEIATKAGGDASLENIVPYITNKFDEFTASDFMRPIIGQQESSFNFREIIDSKKILLVNLSKGRLGERNANLLGLIIVGKLFMAALSRADNPRGDFPPFYLYIDEFQNITTNSIPGILSEARKYKLSLTLAHQYLAQIDEKIRDAVFGNVGSMSIFRVGQEDGEFFGKLFEPTFSASDFTNIENRNAYVRILAGGVPQKPFNIKTLNLAEGNFAQVDDLRELSYLTYGRDRATVEASIKQRYLS